MWSATAIITLIFYFILSAFHTEKYNTEHDIRNEQVFLPIYLTFRRNPFYAIGYAANDIVLIVLWILATIENTSYLSVVVVRHLLCKRYIRFYKLAENGEKTSGKRIKALSYFL